MSRGLHAVLIVLDEIDDDWDEPDVEYWDRRVNTYLDGLEHDEPVLGPGQRLIYGEVVDYDDDSQWDENGRRDMPGVDLGIGV